jgi:hypothetical protein
MYKGEREYIIQLLDKKEYKQALIESNKLKIKIKATSMQTNELKNVQTLKIIYISLKEAHLAGFR